MSSDRPARRIGLLASLRRPPGRYLAGLASAVFPGLGQLLLGRPRLAVLFGVPVLAGLAAAGYYVVTTGRLALVAELASPITLAGLLALQAAILVWRLASVAAALLDRRWPALRRRDALPVVLLCAFAILPQAFLGYVTNAARETAEAVFRPDAQAVATPAAGAPSSATPTGPAPASATPAPSGVPPSRITVLLIGMDSEPGRSTALTDTLIVASFDPAAKTVSMVSVPRDMVDVPLPDGGVFQPKINSLLTYAQLYPGTYPSPGGDPHRLLEAALGNLLGVRIDYYAQLNLPGFVALVDSVGGVDVDVAHGICDPSYHDFGLNGFLITAGRHHLNGAQALGYARVRKAYGESDFTRAARQQEVVVALKDAVERGGFLRDPLGFLAAVRQTVQTNLPPELLPTLVAQGDALDRSAVYRAVIQPPLVRSSPIPDPRGSIQLPDLAAIRLLGQHLFPAPGTLPDPSYATAGTPPAAPSPVAGSTGSGGTSAGSTTASAGPSTPAPGLPADDAEQGRAPICPAPAAPAPATPAPTATQRPAPTPTAGSIASPGVPDASAPDSGPGSSASPSTPGPTPTARTGATSTPPPSPHPSATSTPAAAPAGAP